MGLARRVSVCGVLASLSLFACVSGRTLHQENLAKKCGTNALMVVNDLCYGPCDGILNITTSGCTCDGGSCSTWEVGETGPTEDATEDIKDAATDVANASKDAATDVANASKDAATDVANASKDAATDVANASKDAATDVANASKDAATDVAEGGRNVDSMKGGAGHVGSAALFVSVTACIFSIIF